MFNYIRHILSTSGSYKKALVKTESWGFNYVCENISLGIQMKNTNFSKNLKTNQFPEEWLIIYLITDKNDFFINLL